jgi:hypothetical protein
MKLSAYAAISAVVSLAYAIALLFFSIQFIQNYGVTLDANASVIARLLGSTMLGYAVIFWMNRNLPSGDRAWSGILWASVLFNVVNIIIVVMAITSKIGNSMNWSTVAVNAIFALASLYYVMRKK